MTTVLDAIRVDAGRRVLRGTRHRVAVATVIVDVFQVEGMDVTGEVSKNGMVSHLPGTSMNSRVIGKQRTHPKIVRRTLIQKSTPQPEMRKTPSGGTDSLSV